MSSRLEAALCELSLLHAGLFAPPVLLSPVGNVLARVRLLAAPLTRDSQEHGCTPICWAQRHFCGVGPSPEHLPHLPQGRGPVLLSHSSHHWPFAFTGAGLRSPLRGTPPRLLRGGQPHADFQGNSRCLSGPVPLPAAPPSSAPLLPHLLVSAGKARTRRTFHRAR